MNIRNSPSHKFGQLFVLMSSIIVALLPMSFAQTAPSPTYDAATMAKYDKNHDGKLDADEIATMEADQKRVPVEASAGPAKPDETIMLSPFEVVTDDKGYFAANTMSGTRFNTKVEDLASSLTVVTKQQMSDLAMLDINDVFLYTASTEGSGTYTAYSVDRNGSVSDSVQLNPTQANRIRGIAPANVSFGNYESMGRVPIDPIIIDGVEVSRGPNANVFGLGNPSGTVNQVPATANVTRDLSQVVFRADNYDGYRTSLDLNRVVIKDKLAIRASGVFQHDGFERKPSGVNTERFNAMIKYKPFKSTTISAAYYYYRMNGNRPNFSPPRDSVSYWLASGKPSWDPVTQTIHVGGATLGPYPTATGLPDYFNNSFTGSTHSYVFVDQSGLGYWTAPNTTVTLSSTGTLTNSGAIRFMSPSPGAGTSLGKFTAQPLFTTTPSVNDKSIYDWSSINIASINRVMDRTGTANVQVDQIFINSQMQTLAAQVGWLREDSQRYQRNLIGVANDNGQSGQLLVDVNERLLDGTPNPYFGRTYIGTDQPRTEWDPAKWDTYRAQAAYRLDLTQEKGWLKYLGFHQLTGYDEYKYRINRRYSYRDAIADTPSWLPAGVSRGNQGAITGGPNAAPNLTRGYYRYYVGDANGTNVDYAPTEFTYGNYPFVYGNPTNGFIRDPRALGQVAVTDATGGPNNSKTILKTAGAVIQSHFFDDRLVTTFGLREDKQYVKNGNTPQLLNADGETFNYDSLNHWQAGDYKFNSGKTKQGGAVLRPFRDFGFLKNGENNGGVGGFFSGVLRSLALTYNKSDSFLPQDPRISLYQNALPNPQGKGKDYGFWLNVGDKLVVRFNRYDTKQLQSRGGDASTIAQRVLRMDVASNAPFLLQTQALAWVTQLHPTWTTPQITDEVAKEMGLSANLQNTLLSEFNAGSIASTQDIDSTGTEIEINYNPTRYWTVQASVTEGKTVNSNVSSDINQWISERLPIWTTIVDPRTNALWWTTNYGGSQTPAQNYASFIQAPFSVVKQLEGKSAPDIRKYNARLATSFGLAAISDNNTIRKFTIGGALRWEDKGAIGYYGKQSLPAIITDLDASRPIYDKAHLYVDAFVKYRTPLFYDRVMATFQVNVRNIEENGRLQPIGAYPDGTPNAYRIVDPRQFIVQVTFDM